jgi:hypothetical protein
MTKHDYERKIRAEECNVSDIESLRDAIRGLQSTDDPSLVPLHDELLDQLLELEKKQKK